MPSAVISRSLAVGIAIFYGAVFAGQDSSQNPDITHISGESVTEASADWAPHLSVLSPKTFLQMLISRSVEVQYSKLNTDVSEYLKQGEASLYETTGFMAIRKEGRNRQRTADERLQNTLTAGTAILDESADSDEIGLRNKLPTGAEVSVSYKSSRKSNNLIPQTSAFDTEYNALLNLTLKQPLLRNAGRSVTETDRRVAELEHRIALQQLTQQILKSSIDGLNLYWQLHRAQETLKLRKEAIASTEGLLADTNARVTAGKLPASTIMEVQRILLNRQAELVRSEQGLREAQSKLSTAINVVWSEAISLGTAPATLGLERELPAGIPKLETVLQQWTPYQIALLKHQQAQERLHFAKNQIEPSVDFVLSYSGTGYNNKIQDARMAAEQSAYPDWYFGVNFEFPLNGNQKAQKQFLAQSARVTQAELEILAIQTSFSNDLDVRLSDLKNAQSVLQSSQKEVKLRQAIVDNEQQKTRLGSGLLGTLIQRQVDLIESKQRLLENQVRFEIAMATWQYTQGSLLSDNQIQISDASASDQ